MEYVNSYTSACGNEKLYLEIRNREVATENKEIDWDSIDMSLSVGQTQQFVTLYQALQPFDDRAVQYTITCPRLCFAGSNDVIVYGERWGDVTVDIVGPLLNKAHELKSLGWDVCVLNDLDHMSAMQPANALPVIKQWFVDKA